MSIILEWTNCGIRIHKIEYTQEKEQTTIPHGLISNCNVEQKKLK